MGKNLSSVPSLLLCPAVGCVWALWSVPSWTSGSSQKPLFPSWEGCKTSQLGHGIPSALALWLLTSALNLWVKGWFIFCILHLFQMIETNDISEEKIKMKETMEGMKLLFLP